MEDLLTKTGLNDLQARIYLHLLDAGMLAPPLLAKDLHITRTNAYKVLDSLESLSLVQRQEIRNKIVYQAADPSALASLVAEERNRVIALEHSVKEAMQQLRGKYRKTTAGNVVSVEHGKNAIIEAYERQANKKEVIYFIKSRSDILALGFETMDRLRRLGGKLVPLRRGITTDSAEASANEAIDKSGNLERTWLAESAYTSPVEWAVSGDELLIINFDADGSVIRIKNNTVAQSFIEIWSAFNDSLRANSNYITLPKKAKRKI